MVDKLFYKYQASYSWKILYY